MKVRSSGSKAMCSGLLICHVHTKKSYMSRNVLTLDKYGVKLKKQPKPTLQGILGLAYSYQDKFQQVSCQLRVNHLLATLGLRFVLVTFFRVVQSYCLCLFEEKSTVSWTLRHGKLHKNFRKDGELNKKDVGALHDS